MLYVNVGTCVEVRRDWKMSHHIFMDGKAMEERIWDDITTYYYTHCVHFDIGMHNSVFENVNSHFASHQSGVFDELMKALPMLSKDVLELIITPYCSPVGSFGLVKTLWSDGSIGPQRLLRVEKEDRTVIYQAHPLPLPKPIDNDNGYPPPRGQTYFGRGIGGGRQVRA